MIQEDDRLVGAVVRGTLPGEDEEVEVRARVIVNAAGPWVDAIRLLENPEAERKLQLTKGIHLVVPHSRLPIRHTIIMNTPDKRSIFAVPRERFVYIGTTDTFFEAPEYWPEVTREDVDYLLATVNRSFGVEPLTDEDILATWSGLRPVLWAEGKKPSEISRRHEIMEGSGGMLTIAGGKLTSYRSMAERVVDRCEEQLGRDVTPAGTAEEPLPGGDFTGTFEELSSYLQAQGLAPEEADRAIRMYGEEAFAVFADKKGVAAEVEQAVRNEGALTLEDYWFRRSGRGHFSMQADPAELEEAARHMAEWLGWSPAEQERQIASCRSKRDIEMQCFEPLKEAAHS
jgi:glycerol-3-phosphate dehydrogenase